MATTMVVAGVAVLLVGCVSGSAQRPESSNAENAAEFNMQLGIAYLRQGNLPLAQEKLTRALEQNPRDPNVHTALGLLNDRLDRPREADEHYRAALRLAPRDPDVLNNYAVYLCKRGRYDEGVKRFEEVANNRLYRAPEAAYTNAGVCNQSAQRFDEAERLYRRALTVRPNYAEAVLQLGNLMLQLGRNDEAKAEVDRYLANFTATPELLFLGVRASRVTGDIRAEERFARRLKVDFPDSAPARALATLPRNPG
ncbi:MAG: type IV pilus biogenesis/stability protein PilW [Pseudomonadales bacterium]|nr:type IV pilus biogenesis/stability protein PilW [Pseudomonadales bacterium]